MKSSTFAAAVVLIAPMTMFGGVVQTPPPRIVTICMEVRPGTPWNVAQAQATTTRMFADIGVTIKWRMSVRQCSDASGETIIASLRTGAPLTSFPGALAYARPDDGVIDVFYDRVLGTVTEERVAVLLAHVFAHEIGHVLQRSSHHSPEGVMKAHWDSGDYREMAWKPLRFMREDVELILRGMELRP